MFGFGKGWLFFKLFGVFLLFPPFFVQHLGRVMVQLGILLDVSPVSSGSGQSCRGLQLIFLPWACFLLLEGF